MAPAASPNGVNRITTREHQLLTEVRYPNVQVTIWESHPFGYGEEDDEFYSVENPDASRILERVRSTLRENGVGGEEIEEYTREAIRRCTASIGSPKGGVGSE